MKLHRKSLLVFFVFFAISANTLGHSTPGSNNHLETPISLQFRDIEVASLLQILAKLGKANFILSEAIKGKISVDLQDTPWQTALHSILASRGLRLVKNGSIYWIGPHAEKIGRAHV